MKSVVDLESGIERERKSRPKTKTPDPIRESGALFYARSVPRVSTEKRNLRIISMSRTAMSRISAALGACA
jgi:hypothetical protein